MFGELFHQASVDHSDRVALWAADGTQLLTWSELGERAGRLRGALMARGVGVGGRVAGWLPRGKDEVALMLAVIGIGAVWVSIPRKTPVAQARWQAEDAQPALVVGDAQSFGAFAALKGDLVVVEIRELENFSAAAPVQMVASDALAALAYTSGSTGRPKGVMISHGNLGAALTRLDGYLAHRPSDRLLGLMPLGSPWGMLQILLAAKAGASVVLPPAALLPGELANTIRLAGVTGMAALPPTWLQLTDWLVERREVLPELRYVTTSGGVLPARTWAAFPNVFTRAAFFATYGLTEAFRTTVVLPEWFARKTGSFGRPASDVGIMLIAEGDRLAATDEPGELVHHGECVTHGYWRRPEDTAAAYAPRAEHLALFAGTDRVHYSGDIVRRDADGFLWFVARRDNLIKTGGHRVSAEEIEHALLLAAMVRHAVVFGVPDETLGQALVAVLELTSPQTCDSLPAIQRHARSALASHQMPRYWWVWTDFMPVTSTGKIDRPMVIREAKNKLGLGP